jgi:DNA topoisomerase-2|tara:strand:+ start:2398 stop:3750 length:1353 start_codon:yes stop_codon:yes gene_type:complete
MSDLTMFTSENKLGTPYPISKVALNEWKSFAMYTVESRAIPNMIDGLKPVQRFYLYSSLINSKKDFKKVSAVSGIISDYGYNHGEASAAGAGQLMAATWNNNICLVEGRGSFGTRLVQEAGAARYVYTRLHDNFGKYVKDLDLSPVHDDPEHEPPAFYLPAIPLVLINGTKGIATGFATNILPHCPASVTEACVEYLETKEIKKPINLKFPEFNGTIEQNKEDPKKYISCGTYSKKSKTQLLISEVPYGFDRESYVKVLDNLEDEGDIVSYDDLCDKQGFKFEVKLKQNISAKWTRSKIIGKFKLAKPFAQNLTVIDYEGKLREYDDARQLIKDFCDYRLGILKQRIDARKAEYEEEVRWLNVKMEFVQANVDGRIVFKDNSKAQVIKQIMQETSGTGGDTNRLLALSILNLTKEEIVKLKKQIAESKRTLHFWKKTTPINQFKTDLETL